MPTSNSTDRPAGKALNRLDRHESRTCSSAFLCSSIIPGALTMRSRIEKSLRMPTGIPRPLVLLKIVVIVSQTRVLNPALKRKGRVHCPEIPRTWFMGRLGLHAYALANVTSLLLNGMVRFQLGWKVSALGNLMRRPRFGV